MLLGLLFFPYTISTEDSLNSSKPETSAENKQVGGSAMDDFWNGKESILEAYRYLIIQNAYTE